MTQITKEAIEAAEREFTEYFVRNYPGPDTIIFDPKWHAPKLFRAATRSLISSPGKDGGQEVELAAYQQQRAEQGLEEDPTVYPDWSVGGGHEVEVVNVEGSPLLEWAVDQWKSQVKHRPLVNVHRRSLDDVWRQVIRWAGGDPDKLVGPPHDELLAMESKR